jgi:hypothetical protein
MICGMGAPGVSCRFPHMIIFTENRNSIHTG